MLQPKTNHPDAMLLRGIYRCTAAADAGLENCGCGGGRKPSSLGPDQRQQRT